MAALCLVEWSCMLCVYVKLFMYNITATLHLFIIKFHQNINDILCTVSAQPWLKCQHKFLAATKQLYEWFSPSVCPSVRLSVCPSVRLSHLFDYVPIILSSWNFQELLPVTKVTSMQKVKVRGQRSRSQRSRPKFSFPDCNSSLNSHMMMKWCI